MSNIDIQYSVYHIMHNTYKTNDKRRTTKSISDNHYDILHNVSEINSFGGCFGKLHMHSTEDNVDTLPDNYLKHLKSILNEF